MSLRLSQRQLLCASIVALVSGIALAQSTDVKVIGASFFEAPPNRDKNLVPFGAGFGQEKVEVHAIISAKDRLLIDLQGMGRDQAVTATGMHANKSIVQLGGAEIGSFPKVSADRKMMSIAMSVSRLPDNVPTAVSFNGTINVRAARSQSQKSVKLTMQSGAALDFGIGDVKLAKYEPTLLKLAGGEGIERIASLRFVGADGRAIAGERAGYSRMNSRYEIEYKFAAPIAGDGKLEATLLDNVETLTVPIRVTVTKPY
jgi:hypothetical protein